MLHLTTLLSLAAALAFTLASESTNLVARDSTNPTSWINNIPDQCNTPCTTFVNAINACASNSGSYDNTQSTQSTDATKCMCTNDNAASLTSCATCISNSPSASADLRSNMQSGLTSFSSQCGQYSIPPINVGPTAPGALPGPVPAQASTPFFSVHPNSAPSFQDEYGIFVIVLVAIAGLFVLL